MVQQVHFPSEESNSGGTASEVTWEDVKRPVCTLLDAPKTDGGPAEWGERALKILSDAGMTRYKTAAQRARVHVRLAVIGRFYQRYRAHREGLPYYSSTENLLAPLDLKLAPLLQSIPEDVALNGGAESEHELIRRAFQYLLDEERRPVLDALVEGFEGRQRFFMWLWLSDRREEEYRYDKEEYWDEDEEAFKERVIREYTDGDLETQVMMHTFPEKQSVYEWVMRQI